MSHTPQHTPTNIANMANLIHSQERWTHALDKYPYSIDATLAPWQQWVQFCQSHMSELAQSDPSSLSSALADVVNYSQSVPLYAYQPIVFNDLDVTRKTILDDVFQHMIKHNITFEADATLAYDVSFHEFKQNNAIPDAWSAMEQHGMLPNPKHALMDELWQKTFVWGAAPNAGFLVGHGLLPKQTGGLIHLLGSKKYGSDETILSLVNDLRSLEVLKTIPADHIKPMVNVVYADGETPLHKAARHIFPEYVDFLLSLGATLVMSAKGQYPLDVVRRTKSRTQGLEQLVHLLGQHTAKSPKDLFVQGIQSMDVSMMELAHSKGADMNAICQDPEVLSALFENIPGGRLKKARVAQVVVLNWLLDNNVSLVMNNQSTVMHLAVQHGALPCVEVLLQRRPDLITHKDAEGKTPAQQNTVMVDKYPSGRTWLLVEEEPQYLATTQINLAKMYIKHGIAQEPGDFPTIAQHAPTKAAYDKLMMTQHVGERGIERKKLKL